MNSVSLQIFSFLSSRAVLESDIYHNNGRRHLYEKNITSINVANGQAQIGKIVHLTFFSEEKTSDGTIYHSFVRVVLRGTVAVYVKER